MCSWSFSADIKNFVYDEFDVFSRAVLYYGAGVGVPRVVVVQFVGDSDKITNDLMRWWLMIIQLNKN